MVEQDMVVSFLQEQAAKLYQKERVLVVYFEAMKANFPAQIDCNNVFLNLPMLTNNKRMAVTKAYGFTTMKGGTAGKMTNIITRKGSIGDWRNHSDQEMWIQFDDLFVRRLGNVNLASAMRHFQW